MKPQDLDYFVIGAQKCATSWMYYCLRDHPDICVPSKKLEAGYVGGAMFKEMGEEWFFDRFQPKPDQITGDVSVEYMWDPTAAEALRAYATKAKLVISLRHPVDRMVSGYFWLLRKGDLPNIPLEDGIAQVLASEPGFSNPLDGPLDQVVRRSCYGPQIQRYIDVYGAEKIKVILYEDVAEDGLAQMQSIYQFLGVDDGFVPPSLNSAPKKNSYNSWLLAVENSTRSKTVARLCNYAHQVIDYVSPRRDILSRDMRRQLNTLFAPAIEDIRAVLQTLPHDQCPSDQTLTKRWNLD